MGQLFTGRTPRPRLQSLHVISDNYSCIGFPMIIMFTCHKYFSRFAKGTVLNQCVVHCNNHIHFVFDLEANVSVINVLLYILLDWWT